MKLGTKQELFTINIAKLILHAESLGYKARIREVQRTKQQQEIYIKEGKSKTRNSKHLDSLAADIYFFKNGKLLLEKEDLQELGDYWENLQQGNRWGGGFKSFVDTPHFEA